MCKPRDVEMCFLFHYAVFYGIKWTFSQNSLRLGRMKTFMYECILYVVYVYFHMCYFT